MRRGITGRWLVNTFGVILAIVVFLVVVLSAGDEHQCRHREEK